VFALGTFPNPILITKCSTLKPYSQLFKVTSYFVKPWKCRIHSIKSSWVHLSIEINLPNDFFWPNFPSGFDGQGVLNKNLLFCQMELDLYPTFLPTERTCSVSQHTHLQKYICKYKPISKFWKTHFFIIKKSEKVFGKLTLGNSEFAECKIWQFHSSDQLSAWFI